MAKLFLIEEFKIYERVGFYTIRDDNNQDSETDNFIQRFFDKNHSNYQAGYYNDLTLILTWIEQIGNRGLGICSLRHENVAKALPPSQISAKDLSYLGTRKGKLRLYCIPLPPGIMILCGGGLKTSQKVQDSPDLLRHFRFANKIATEITNSLVNGELAVEDIKLKGNMEIWL
ncbi:MAG: hypothetical protein SF052_27700 [Bacteroidia bacterium]|nr:hypothetical protein [Bacteroidia bacterium]